MIKTAMRRLQLLILGSMILSAGLCRAEEATDVQFIADFDGSKQRYVIVLPSHFDAQRPSPLLLALHGHGGDRWQFVKDTRDECRAARDAAEKFGMIYVSPDYRAKTSWMGPAAEADVLQIIKDLKTKYPIRQVVISGGSMGGTGALTFAALHPDQISGVVSLNGTANLVEYQNYQDAIAASFGGSKTKKPEEYRRRSAELNADKLTMPIAMTAGGKDVAVPPDSVIRLSELLNRQKTKYKLFFRPENGHATNYADSMAAFEFVCNILKEQPE